jgi:hypothetical protein
MSPHIHIGPESVLAAHAPSPPAAGSRCPAGADSAPHSEQNFFYAKDKSGKKVSTDDDEAAGTDLRKELAAAKKQLEKANNKLAGLGRQNGRKEDLSGAKSKKDDKPKPKPRDKDTAPSSEGAAQ